MPPDFFLLAGALGSGKTSLLLDFLGHSEAAETAVIVNDVGQINIDGAVIGSTSGGLDMATLDDGCVCCSLGNDLLFTIEALLLQRAAANRGPFRRMILECSGLSRPGRIIRGLGSLAGAGMPLAVLSTFDCSSAAQQEFDDAAAQLAAAQCIVLTKLDRVDVARIGAAQAEAAGFNPLATILCEPDRRRRARRAFSITAASLPRLADAPAGGPLDHPRIAVFLARFAAPPAWCDLSDWLENLAGACGDRLLRVKGIVQLADCADPVLLQAVGCSFDQPRLMPGLAADGLVIIARDTPLAEVQSLTPELGLAVSRSLDRRALICT